MSGLATATGPCGDHRADLVPGFTDPVHDAQASAPPAANPVNARFALIADAAALPSLEGFALGSDEYPDRSTTLVIEVAGLTAGRGMRLAGPGIRGEALLGVAGLPARLLEERAALVALLPRGLDVILVSGTRLAALPRWTRVTL